MKINKYLLFVVLSAFLLVIAGCGDEKTIYEDGTQGDTNVSDTTPDAFTFTSQADVQPGATVTSNSITVSGINQAAPISVTGGSYSIGSGDFTTSAGTVTNGQTVRVQHTASASNSATTTTTLTIGGISASFKSTTVADSGGGTPAPPGKALFDDNCSGCHAAVQFKGKGETVASLKAVNMSMGQTDANLQLIVDYLNSL